MWIFSVGFNRFILIEHSDVYYDVSRLQAGKTVSILMKDEKYLKLGHWAGIKTETQHQIQWNWGYNGRAKSELDNRAPVTLGK